MRTTSEITSDFSKVKGASLDYTCGVVGTAKPIVFNGGGQRLIETKELNTVETRLDMK